MVYMTKPILFSDLSATEQALFQVWASDIQAIAQRSTRPSIALDPPVLKILSTPTKGDTHIAFTDGASFSIARDLLSEPIGLRHYMIAHELGHAEGFHPWFTFGALIGLTLGAAAFGPISSGKLGSHAVIASITAIAIAVAGFLIAIAKTKSMLFEWDADRRAARMVTVPTMINGIALIEKIRGLHTKPFYDNKRARLLGNPSSIWQPRV